MTAPTGGLTADAKTAARELSDILLTPARKNANYNLCWRAADLIYCLSAEIDRLQALLKGSEALKAGYLDQIDRLKQELANAK